MRLANFDLVGPEPTITLVGLGHFWDLHNFAEFEGLAFDAATASLTLRWTVPAVEDPWGSNGNEHMRCELVFSGVRFCYISDRGDDNTSSDRDLAEMLRVTPELGEYRMRTEWPANSDFHLRFEFMSGRAIEIGAIEVELRGTV